MKTRIIPFICLLLIFCCSNLISKEAISKTDPPRSATIIVYTSPQLYDIAAKWAGEYTIANPDQNVKVIKIEETEIAARLIIEADG